MGSPLEDEDAPFEEDGEDGGSISLGWVFHAAMSAKARLGWLLGTAYRSLVAGQAQPRKLTFERQEPNLGGRGAPSIAPDAEDEEFESDEEEDDEDPEDEDEGTVIEAQLRHIWHLVSDGAVESIEKGLPLHLQT